MAGHRLEHAARLVQAAAERHHHLQVGQAHHVAHPLERLALEREAFGIGRVDVARRAAEADHRVLLVRLEHATAQQRGVLVALEVRQAHDHRPRIEGRGDGADALGQPLDEVARRRPRSRPTGPAPAHAPSSSTMRSGCSTAIGCTLMCSLMTNSMRARPTPSQGSMLVWKASSGLPRLTMISVRGLLQAGDVADLAVERHGARVDLAHRAFGARDGHALAVGQRRGGVLGAHHRRDAELTRDDRRMAGAPAAVGDDRRSRLHHRLPVRRGGVRHQHLARLELGQVARVGDQPHRAGGDARADRAAARLHFALAVEHELLDLRRRALRHRRLRPRLHDVQRPVRAVLGPLDVHRPGVPAWRL